MPLDFAFAIASSVYLEALARWPELSQLRRDVIEVVTWMILESGRFGRTDATRIMHRLANQICKNSILQTRFATRGSSRRTRAEIANHRIANLSIEI